MEPVRQKSGFDSRRQLVSPAHRANLFFAQNRPSKVRQTHNQVTTALLAAALLAVAAAAAALSVAVAAGASLFVAALSVAAP